MQRLPETPCWAYKCKPPRKRGRARELSRLDCDLVISAPDARQFLPPSLAKSNHPIKSPGCSPAAAGRASRPVSPGICWVNGAVKARGQRTKAPAPVCDGLTVWRDRPLTALLGVGGPSARDLPSACARRGHSAPGPSKAQGDEGPRDCKSLRLSL